MKSKKTIAKRRSGASTVEMAMVAPFVFLLVFGSLEFTRMMMVVEALNNAAREGCRHACLANTTDSAQSVAIVQESLNGVLMSIEGEGGVSIVVEPSFKSPPVPGTKITTTVEVGCDDISWLPPFFFGGATLQHTTTMVRE